MLSKERLSVRTLCAPRPDYCTRPVRTPYRREVCYDRLAQFPDTPSIIRYLAQSSSQRYPRERPWSSRTADMVWQPRSTSLSMTCSSHPTVMSFSNMCIFPLGWHAQRYCVRRWAAEAYELASLHDHVEGSKLPLADDVEILLTCSELLGIRKC